ncbi:MAG: methyltransferase domain-containing protein [Solirubrobacteraceae bacterium]
MTAVSVVIPVKDGERFLDEVLAAVARERPDEVLVIDSGSCDRSVEIALKHGARVDAIAPESFGHGKTRSLGVDLTEGELVCFLTQDATPVEGWLSAYRAVFDSSPPDLGAAYGPHLPRPETSPMIARELEEFFAGFSADGVVVHEQGDPAFLSNVNACYRRSCLSEIGFRDVAYSEDQAFGEDMLAAGWRKAFVPGAAVLHAHDYGLLGFMRRYFDEYRGLRQSTGHVEPFGIRSWARVVREQVAADRDYLRRRGTRRGELARWSARGVVHHAGRRAFSALGSRADRLPSVAQRALSLERRGAAGQALAPQDLRRSVGASVEGVRGRHVPARNDRHELDAVVDFLRHGAAPLAAPVPGQSDREHLHVALVIPTFRRGSGGHQTLFQILRELERKGHVCSVWHHDPYGEQRERAAVIRGAIREHFVDLDAPVYKEFEEWFGADVVLATSSTTVWPVLRLPWCRARAYMISDHEPEFYPTSSESYWSELSYRQDLWCIAGTPWLRDLLGERYDAPASVVEYGVDHAVYHPRDVPRRRDTVAFYARSVTPRRAVSLGLAALSELKRRRPDVRVVLFGDGSKPLLTYDYEQLGIADERTLAELYAQATVGMCFSMTNFSRIPKEMMACGLPCVELAGFSAESVFGEDSGPLVLAEFSPDAVADAIEMLLDDEGEWERRSHMGLEYVAEQTWEMTASLTEEGIRDALRARESLPAYESRPLLRPLLPPKPLPVAPVTDRLLRRVDAQDVGAVEEQLPPDVRAWIEHMDEQGRRQVVLHYAVHLGAEWARERTGLQPDEPPEGVHAMVRGPQAAGGAFYEADFVIAACEEAGLELGPGMAGLDFGCSSGRVVRPCAAAFPDVAWHGCDPNQPAIAWAAEHFPDIRFLASSTDPPLPYDDQTFDFVCAVSIWSHFGEAAATAWFDEMKRIVKPGGCLVFTACGFAAIDYYARTGHRMLRQLGEIREALYQRGFWYSPEFGQSGDHGVVHPEWGSSFFSSEWLLARVAPAWHVAVFSPAGNSGNQDIYALRRARNDESV